MPPTKNSLHQATMDAIPTIKRMMEEGFTQREIAYETRLGRNTVARTIKRLLLEGEIKPDPGPSYPNYSAAPVRCNECGAFVYPPCFACQLKAELRKGIKR